MRNEMSPDHKVWIACVAIICVTLIIMVKF